MLNREDNELLCRVGPGTPMGTLMRQYWLPCAQSSELPKDSRAPLRIRLLDENLVAYRLADGNVGLIQDACPHRGASFYLGRNEGDGIRCIYHGWKFDPTGRCVDLPSEPADSNFVNKVRARAYPTRERGGLIWAYMGTSTVQPSLPDLEANAAPDAMVTQQMMRNCNYMQALEGDIDTLHFAFLHTGHLQPGDAAVAGNFLDVQINHRDAELDVRETEFGTLYGAKRPAGNGMDYWRIAGFMFPFYTLIPPFAVAANRWTRAWVPMDDDHTMFFHMMAPPLGDVPNPEEANVDMRFDKGGETLPDDPGDFYGRARSPYGRENDWGIDRSLIDQRISYTGLPGVHLEDQAVTESMGPIVDRSEEHLGTSDKMIIQTRRRLIRAAKALRDDGVTPPGVDSPSVYRQRSGGILLPEGADWFEASAPFREAFVDHTDDDIRSTLGDTIAAD
ncbi:MAG: (2Fe-2S)-binding protein [Gammaproteobacteria bacterium]|nr:(2Fe-2S)-binding protein [Gammaproteobacteria bacterium]|tara:strand:- start:15 stop:1358 length:1344 start_codon:yes stop_codon:yes gene_type:complete